MEKDEKMMVKYTNRKWKYMRKISPTKTGGRLVNLSKILPPDWIYADVSLLKSSNDSVTVQFDVIRRLGDAAKHSTNIPRTTGKDESGKQPD